MPLEPLDDLGTIGIAKDAYPHELAPEAWSDGNNVRFQEGYVQNFLGHGQVFGTPGVAPYFAMPLSVGASRYWIYASLAAIYSVDKNGTHTNITRGAGGAYAATQNAKWVGAPIAGIAILTNPADVPQQWAGTGLCTNLSNWPAATTANSIRACRGHLIAVNVTKGGTNYPHMVKWSHPADPGTIPVTWDPTDATHDAGELDLDDDETIAVDGLALGNTFIAYKEGAYYALDYIGAPFIWSKRLITRTQGVLAANCVANIPGAHCVLGQGDLYVHQGGEPTSVIDQRMRKWLVANIDAANFQRCWLASNHVAKEVWAGLCTPGGTVATVALIWNYKYDTIQIRDLPSATHGASGIVDFATADSWDADATTWDSDTTVWDSSAFATTASRLVLASSTNAKMYLTEVTNSFDGATMNCAVRRTGLAFDAPELVKLVRQMRPIIDAPYGTVINIFAGGSMDQATEPTWNGPFPFVVGQQQELDLFATGRFLGFRFESATTSQWRMKKYLVDIQPLGTY